MLCFFSAKGVLSNQFITFVQSAEKAAFTNILEKESSNSVNHITIFNKSLFNENREKLPSMPKDTVKTDDAFIIHDKKFFNEFNYQGDE